MPFPNPPTAEERAQMEARDRLIEDAGKAFDAWNEAQPPKVQDLPIWERAALYAALYAAQS
jgi:hypothetical protein